MDVASDQQQLEMDFIGQRGSKLDATTNKLRKEIERAVLDLETFDANLEGELDRTLGSE